MRDNPDSGIQYIFAVKSGIAGNLESSTRNPDFTAWNPESGTFLDSFTLGDAKNWLRLGLIRLNQVLV